MTREEAITIIDNLHLIGCGRNQHENDLKINIALDIAIEALSVDIVKCKDCKYGQYDATHYFCAEHGHKVYDDDFCSYGERKEE